MLSLQQAYLNVASKVPTDPNIKKRLDRAYDICINKGYTLTQHGDDIWHVYRSSTSLLDDTSITYVVDSATCTCPDYATARGGLCKHRLAVMMKIAMMADDKEDIYYA